MSRQANVTDISRYFRKGGIDWDRLALNFDAVGIMGWIGNFMDQLYPEHLENALARDMLVFTIHIPHAEMPIDEQLDQIFELPGILDHPICGDLEPTDGKMVNEYQARKFFEGLDLRSGQSSWYYSNYYYTSKIGFPAWIKPRVKYWAEYPIDIVTKYRKIDRYLQKNPWTIPKWAIKAGYTPEIHQLTDYGDAPFYYAKAKTEDPDFPTGKKSCDLGVSLIDVDEFRALFPGNSAPTLEQRVENLENRVKVLSGFHGI